jgi:hypothetical protein
VPPHSSIDEVPTTSLVAGLVAHDPELQSISHQAVVWTVEGEERPTSSLVVLSGDDEPISSH